MSIPFIRLHSERILKSVIAMIMILFYGFDILMRMRILMGLSCILKEKALCTHGRNGMIKLGTLIIT